MKIFIGPIASVLIFSVLVSCGSCDSPSKKPETVKSVDATPGISELDQKLRDDPNNPELYLERALYYKRNQDYVAASNDVERALVLDSTNSRYVTEKGNLLYATGRLGEAKFALERAMELDPQNTEAKLSMAEIFFVLTNQERSMRLINDALKIDDQLVKAYFLKGLIYKEQGNARLSKSSFQTVTELDPDHVEAFNLLGMLYASEGDSLALQYYSSALRVDSTNREVLYNRAYFYQDQVRPSEALWAYDELIRQYPNTAVAYYNKGFVQLGQLSEPEQAVNSFTEAIRLDPNYYQAYCNRAIALEELGRISQATADFKRTLEIKQNFEPAIKGLNRIN